MLGDELAEVALGLVQAEVGVVYGLECVVQLHDERVLQLLQDLRL